MFGERTSIDLFSLYVFVFPSRLCDNTPENRFFQILSNIHEPRVRIIYEKKNKNKNKKTKGANFPDTLIYWES